MADRWSNPSGSVGFDRFRVWPLGSDSYAHTDLANNWDTLDGILGNSPSANWPPTTGLNGGIYGVIQALAADIATVSSRQPVEFGLYSARPSVGSTTTGTVYVATDTGGVFQMTGAAWILIAQKAVPTLPGALAALTPYDGQLIDLVDSLANPTYRWRFVYNASRSDAYKWEFVGGTDRLTTTPAVWTSPNDNTGGFHFSASLFTIPVTGIYQFHATVNVNLFNLINNSIPSPTASVAFSVGSQVGAPHSIAAGGLDGGGNLVRFPGLGPVDASLAVSTNDIVKLRSGSAGDNAFSFGTNLISIRPQRLAQP